MLGLESAFSPPLIILSATPMHKPRQTLLAMVTALCFGSSATHAGPVEASWTVAGPDDTAAVACAALSGWYATADSYENNIEIRDVTQNLLITITQSQITSLLPWMTLDGSTDGPDALAFSDSGRLLFIGVHDANAAGDAQPSDAILRYDTQTGALTVFARLEISGVDNPWPHNSLVHYKGKLYAGVTGQVRVYRAQMNDLTGTLLSTVTTGAGLMVNGLTIDRTQDTLYAVWGDQIRRSPLSTISFTSVGSPAANIRAIAYSDHYGGVSNAAPTNAGLYALEATTSPAFHRVWFIPPAQARGTQTFAPTAYLSGAVDWHDLAASADGALLAGADEDAVRISDSTDTRLSFNAWKSDEFAQVVAFGRGLISPDGEPPGWVIDANVQLGWTRFHPATADGAAWTVLLLLMSDHINADPLAQGLVRTILERYAGLSPDGIKPQRTADGIYRHWLNPINGGLKPGWDPEYATLSTMKIVVAAARAAAYYPADTSIQQSARAIICGVSNWDAYIAATDAMYFKGLAGGGPDTSLASMPFHEGIIWAQQASVYGTTYSQNAYADWFNRSMWPTATLVTGRPITSNVNNVHQSAFLSLYPLLLMSDYRAASAWQTQITNLRLSNAAWTDDNGPKFNTVFSAGTTRSDWYGGYHADSLSAHTGDVTTFPSLMAFSAATAPSAVPTAPAVAAYNAYRRGARQTFLGGASILYRRSNVDQAYQPNSAGLPDVALGGLALADLIQPGSVALVLTGEYPSCLCPSDFNEDGFVSGDDFDAFVAAFELGDASADFNNDTFVSGDDFDGFTLAFEAGC